MTDASKTPMDHKYLNPECCERGCQTLVLQNKIDALLVELGEAKAGYKLEHDWCLGLRSDLATLTRQRDGLKEALTLADKIICTCGYAGRPELRNGIRAAHTVISVALGKELPLHMIEEAELVKKDVLDDWPNKQEPR